MSSERRADWTGDPDPPPRGDARAAALAGYLRTLAAESEASPASLDGTGLLEAAGIAERMSPDDPRLRALSDAGHFGSTPGGRVLFLATPEVRAVVRRQLVSGHQSGVVLLARLVATATGPDEARTSLDELSWRVREAREHVQRQRQGKVGTQALFEARHGLLVALEAYVAALQRRRFPVPPLLHGELELHRKLFP
ncbi:hypothetical protein [Nocardioides taihuensis]|uniref:Uncharacterized protein n=1 Tax=Nocardioides taihuensis TaxID=1835606 RepID=A0ABW0BDI1_9ACTN